MGADSFVVFFGIKIPLDPEDEDTLDDWGAGTHPVAVAARAVGLDVHAGQLTDGGDCFVLLGRRLAWIGLEHDGHVRVAPDALAEAAAAVGPPLRGLGRSESPALHLQLEAQY